MLFELLRGLLQLFYASPEIELRRNYEHLLKILHKNHPSSIILSFHVKKRSKAVPVTGLGGL
jgi:hypothetical protein